MTNKEELLPILPLLKLGPHLKYFFYVEFDGTYSFLTICDIALKQCEELAIIYVYIQPMYYFSTFSSYTVASGITFMQITYGLPSESCDAMDKIKLTLQL